MTITRRGQRRPRRGREQGCLRPPRRSRSAGRARRRSSTSRATSRPARRTSLMSAYEEAGDAKAIVLNFTGLDVHEHGWDRAARDAARAREPADAAAARLRPVRPLPQIFELTRLDEAIGIHDTRPARWPRRAPHRGARHERREQRRPRRATHQLGEAGLDAQRRRGARGRRRSTSRASASSARSRASGRCGRRPTRCACRRTTVSGHGPDRGLEAALPGVLARGQRLLRAADRHRAGRGGADRRRCRAG